MEDQASNDCQLTQQGECSAAALVVERLSSNVLSIAWLLAQKPWIVPIPGTPKLHHLEENLGAADVHLDAADLETIASTLSAIDVQGARYPASLQSLVGR